MIRIGQDITRVDITRQHNGLSVQTWKQGWDHDTPAFEQVIVKERIETILMRCEDVGFTCDMIDGDHGRALRGETTRIDLIREAEGKYTFSKYPYGWTARTKPVSRRSVDSVEYQTIIRWCKEKGWIVREFPNGARGWKDKLIPIRDANTIRRMRRTVERDLQISQGKEQGLHSFDLAFDG